MCVTVRGIRLPGLLLLKSLLVYAFGDSKIILPASFQVQSDHFEEFFAPELDKHGYQALYKRKTNEVARNFLQWYGFYIQLFLLFTYSLVCFRSIMEIHKLLMVVQHFSAEIDFRM